MKSIHWSLPIRKITSFSIKTEVNCHSLLLKTGGMQYIEPARARVGQLPGHLVW